MQRLLVIILGVLACLYVFPQGNLNWPESVNLEYFDNNELITQGNATIAIQASNFPYFGVLLPGETDPQNIPSGAIIGVFYDTNNSNMIEEWSCGGFNFWPENNESFTIAAWEDDYSTSELDGFTSNTEYVWFLRINNSDNPSEGWTDYIGQNPIMDNNYDLELCGGQCQQNFVTNGLSNLLMINFTLYSEWTNCMDMSACNYNAQAVGLVDIDFEDQGCEYSENEWVDCDGVCFDDDDDGVCNVNEQVGCMDPNAFNYEEYYTDPATCMYQGCMDPVALNYDVTATVPGPCEYPEYQFDWTVEQGYPLNWAVFAIDNILGLPDYDSFCDDVTIGAFYGNNTYVSNQEAIVDGQLYSVTELDMVQDGLLIEGHYPLFESYITAVLSNNSNATFNSNIYSYDEYIEEISSWNNYTDTASTPYVETIIDPGEYAIPESLLDNLQPELYTGYVGQFLEDVYISTVSSSGITPLDDFPNYTSNYGSGFTGYGNGSFYTCTNSGQYQSLLAIYEDDTTTEEKDGFNNNEPMIFIIELNGVEYLAEPSFHVVTEIDGSQSLQTAEFEQNGMYAADLVIVGPVLFGCTDINYLEYNASANILDGSCVTLMVEGCTDEYAANYNFQANTDDASCYYFGCTDSTYLEYYNYDPINYTISPANYSPELYDVVDDGSCITLIVTGCTDVTAFNYNLSANIDDDSCIAVVEGCTDDTMFNYNPEANTDYDGALCIPFVYGCLDYLAVNYNPLANQDDSSCYYQPGCTDSEALNYDEDADYDDDSCIAIVEGCTIEGMVNYDVNANVNDGSCIPFIYGCTDPVMWNYNSNANTDDGSCIPFAYGCTDPAAFNYDSNANTDDGTCVPFILGCMDPIACNYDSIANTEDGSCAYAETYYDCLGVCLNDIDGDGVCDELEVIGCTDIEAFNYDAIATDDDGSCIAIIAGCVNSFALNFDSSANTDDGSCCYISGCTDNTAFNYNPNACFDDESCISIIAGCTDPTMWNYNAEANIDDDSCIPFIYGCTDDTMFNYNPEANTDFGGVLCIPFISGCTDPEAFNYAINANTDDGSCISVVEGCTDDTAFNYDSEANTDDGSCIPFIYGCMDPAAANYNENANIDNETCFYLIFGCTNSSAYNYNPDANVNDGSCIPFIYGCTDSTAYNYNEDANTDDGSCEPVILGCTNTYYFNYNPLANTDDGSCIPFIYGCTIEGMFNYNPDANFDFGGLLCVGMIEGCIDSEALNYDPLANTDDGSCYYQAGCTDPTAFNYDLDADYDDGSCVAIVEGCTDPTAYNYDLNANTDNGSCIPFIYGCTNPEASNYNPDANTDFGGVLCVYLIYGCTDATAYNYNPDANTDDGSCYPFIFGCLDEAALNYNDYDGDGEGNPLTGDLQVDVNTDFGGIFCEYPIFGCTDPYSINYDSSATNDDGSCIQFVFGCMDEEAANYNEFANIDFGGIFCIYAVYGCTDPAAFNYDSTATDDDGSCIAVVEGCLDATYLEYSEDANTDDGSCATLIVEGCLDINYLEYDSNANTDDGSCLTLIVYGCTDLTAMNYNENANVDDGSCIAVVLGCTDPTMWNYETEANTDDGSCIPFIYGCINPTAFNYDTGANTDDGSCYYQPGCTDPTAFNYDFDADFDDGSCVAIVEGCMDADADNYNPNANVADDSCIIYGCLIDAWYICPESINPNGNATVNNWADCVFIWEGCENSALALPDSPDEYPITRLSEVTDDIIDAYYYLGEDRIGCMDKSADNYLITAVVDDESCSYGMLSLNLEKNNEFKIYPQPASSYIVIEFLGEKSIANQEIVIYNLLGKEILSLIINENKIQLDVNDWVNGVYYATMYLNNNYITHKFSVD